MSTDNRRQVARHAARGKQVFAHPADVAAADQVAASLTPGVKPRLSPLIVRGAFYLADSTTASPTLLETG
jgi:hypothetical protein